MRRCTERTCLVSRVAGVRSPLRGLVLTSALQEWSSDLESLLGPQPAPGLFQTALKLGNFILNCLGLWLICFAAH